MEFHIKQLTTHKFVKTIFNSSLDRNGEEYYIYNTEMLHCLQRMKGKGSSQNTSYHRQDMYAGTNLLHRTGGGQGAQKKKGMWA
jgi:hypothetical protein